MLARAEGLHRELFRPGGRSALPPAWEPPVDVLETDDEVLVLVALPGVNPDRVEVVIDGNDLVVAGVADGNRLGFGSIKIDLGLDSIPYLGGRRGQGNSGRRVFFRRLSVGRTSERQHIRFPCAGDLLGQRVMIWRQKPTIQLPRQGTDPFQVKVMPDACFHAGPVVNGHGLSS